MQALHAHNSQGSSVYKRRKLDHKPASSRQEVAENLNIYSVKANEGTEPEVEKRLDDAESEASDDAPVDDSTEGEENFTSGFDVAPTSMSDCSRL